jgi:hypothetical protein
LAQTGEPVAGNGVWLGARQHIQKTYIQNIEYKIETGYAGDKANCRESLWQGQADLGIHAIGIK